MVTVEFRSRFIIFYEGLRRKLMDALDFKDLDSGMGYRTASGGVARKLSRLIKS